MMGDIYKSCSKVIVCLGKDFYGVPVFPKDSAPPVERFSGTEADLPRTAEILKEASTLAEKEALLEPVHVFAAARGLTMLGPGGGHLPDVPLFFNVSMGMFYVFDGFIRVSWWHRIWVIQEGTLPPAVTVMCDSVTAPWFIFAMVVEGYRRHAETCCSNWVQRNVPRTNDYMNGLSQQLADIEELRRLYQYDPNDSPTERWSLLRLLQTFCGRGSTNARDMVYAFWGLADAEDIVSAVDYSLSVMEVYQRTTLNIIYSTASLDLFSTDVDLGGSRSSWPRWVPNWDVAFLREDSRADITTLYTTCPGFLVTPENVRELVGGGRWNAAEEHRDLRDAPILVIAFSILAHAWNAL